MASVGLECPTGLGRIFFPPLAVYNPAVAKPVLEVETFFASLLTGIFSHRQGVASLKKSNTDPGDVVSPHRCTVTHYFLIVDFKGHRLLPPFCLGRFGQIFSRVGLVRR